MTFGFAMMTVGTLLLISGVRNRSIAEVMQGVFSPNPGGAGEGAVETEASGASPPGPTGPVGKQGVGKGDPATEYSIKRTNPGLRPGIVAATAVVLARFPGLRIESGYRPGDNDSRHGEGRAVDLVGSVQEMNKAAKWIAKYMTTVLDEGIHNPGLSVDTGKTVPPSFWEADWAAHKNHIHLAV